MSTEENKAFVRETVEEIWNKRNLAILDKALTTGYVRHDPASPQPLSLQQHKEFISGTLKAFPDIRTVVEDLIAEGDRVVMRWSCRGTHTGDFMGIPASNKALNFSGITVFRVSGGKIAEQWENYDALGMMQQMGVIPSPGGTEKGA